jgi:hypothetical protein
LPQHPNVFPSTCIVSDSKSQLSLIERDQYHIVDFKKTLSSGLDSLDEFLCLERGENGLHHVLIRGRVVAQMPLCAENLNPNVLTMKSAQYGARIYDAGSLNLARDRRIFVQ